VRLQAHPHQPHPGSQLPGQQSGVVGVLQPGMLWLWVPGPLSLESSSTCHPHPPLPQWGLSLGAALQ
jgi:hypothetical protein